MVNPIWKTDSDLALMLSLIHIFDDADQHFIQLQCTVPRIQDDALNLLLSQRGVKQAVYVLSLIHIFCGIVM